MLAKGFAKYQGLNLAVCVFACGVSNSTCVLEAEFQRESDLLDQVSANLSREFCLVYFSTLTTNITVKQHAYLLHKHRMEAKVRARGRHLILRLGQVVGPSDNPHTLTNFLYSRIFHAQTFGLWQGQSRNLLDLEDVVQATLAYLEKNQEPLGTVLLTNPVNYSIEALVHAFEKLMGRTALTQIVDMPTSSMVFSDDPPLHHLHPCIDVDYYLERTLKKYYGDALPPIQYMT